MGNPKRLLSVLSNVLLASSVLLFAGTTLHALWTLDDFFKPSGQIGIRTRLVFTSFFIALAGIACGAIGEAMTKKGNVLPPEEPTND